MIIFFLRGHGNESGNLIGIDLVRFGFSYLCPRARSSFRESLSTSLPSLPLYWVPPSAYALGRYFGPRAQFRDLPAGNNIHIVLFIIFLRPDFYIAFPYTINTISTGELVKVEANLFYFIGRSLQWGETSRNKQTNKNSSYLSSE